jgi:hypothetical protein
MAAHDQDPAGPAHILHLGFLSMLEPAIRDAMPCSRPGNTERYATVEAGCAVPRASSRNAFPVCLLLGIRWCRAELGGEHHGAVDCDRQTAVPPAKHDRADDQLREWPEGARERIVCLSRAVSVEVATQREVRAKGMPRLSPTDPYAETSSNTAQASDGCK